MFVWECLKSDGRHLGMCVDGFMFGSCCYHNSSANSVEAGISLDVMDKVDEMVVEKIKDQEISSSSSVELEELDNVPFLTRTSSTTTEATTTTSTTTSTTTEKPTTTSSSTTTTTTQRPTPQQSTLFINPHTPTTPEPPTLFQNLTQPYKGCGIAPLLPQKRIVGGNEAKVFHI
jgi:hypothetical protein